MKISVITVSYNSEKTIKHTIESIKRQNYNSIEYIIIDGKSTDSTLNIINQYKEIKLVSEPDCGIYDAMNKGVSLSTGDLICFLNSDDIYADSNVLSEVIHIFKKNSVDFVFGDIAFIAADGGVIRRWVADKSCEDVLSGNQIPHPAFFVKGELLRSLEPPFDSKYRIAADLKQQLILINCQKSKGFYFPKTLVYMRVGGKSTVSFNAYFQGWKESVNAYNEIFNSGGFLFVLRKVISKFKFTTISHFINYIKHVK